jgi:hypothetical protein
MGEEMADRWKPEPELLLRPVRNSPSSCGIVGNGFEIEALCGHSTRRRRLSNTAAATALIGIAGFVLAAMIGPLFSHPDYSSIAHTMSELAGQAMPDAWIMRLGFVSFGLCTAIAAALRLRDRPCTAVPLIIFGVAMMMAALWSNAPIDRAIAHSIHEDEVHSIAASLMGVAFAAASAARLWMNAFSLRDWLSWFALATSIGLPLAMVAFPGVDGGLQRLMFAISFVWIVREVRSPGTAPSPTSEQ